MKVEVLGTGCANCRHTIALIEQVARASGAQIELIKVQDIREIARYGVLATPGVVVDGKVMHAGGVPQRAEIEQWFASARS